MSLTSQIRYVRALDSAATDGSGKTGLAFSDFTIKYLTLGGTLTALTTQTITTLGTFQAPTDAAHIRIKELSNVDPTKGIYEVHFHDTQLVNTGQKLWLFPSASGAAIQPLEVDLLAQSGDAYAAVTANRAEPAQGLPAASTSMLAKLDYLYKAWRNRSTQTATTYKLFNDDAVTVDHKSAVSDDGTTYDRGEVATGP